MFMQFAVLGIGMSELLVIGALTVLVFGLGRLAELPNVILAFVRGGHREFRAYHEDQKKQTGHVEANNN